MLSSSKLLDRWWNAQGRKEERLLSRVYFSVADLARTSARADERDRNQAFQLS